MNTSSQRITLKFDWGAIPITIVIHEQWSSVLPLDHVEVRSAKPTPLSETGYKSLFLAHPCKDWVADLVKERLGVPDPQLDLF